MLYVRLHPQSIKKDNMKAVLLERTSHIVNLLPSFVLEAY